MMTPKSKGCAMAARTLMTTITVMSSIRVTPLRSFEAGLIILGVFSGSRRHASRNDRYRVTEEVRYRVIGVEIHPDVPSLAAQLKSISAQRHVLQGNGTVAQFPKVVGKATIVRRILQNLADLYGHFDAEAGLLIGGRNSRQLRERAPQVGRPTAKPTQVLEQAGRRGADVVVRPSQPGHPEARFDAPGP